MTLRYLTAGESHGKALVGILEGLPAGITVKPEDFLSLMQKRQSGYGRGPRSKKQPDNVEVLGGIVGGKTIGSPVALEIRNNDLSNPGLLDPFKKLNPTDRIIVPLPGHADLAGLQKYDLNDCRLVRERASARETAMRTALSVVPRCMLRALGIRFTCFVEAIGSVQASIDYSSDPEILASSVEKNGNLFLTPDSQIIPVWKKLIDDCRNKNESLGGTGIVIFWNLPAGLGSYCQPDRRLDSRLISQVMTVPAIKGAEINGSRELLTIKTADSIVFSDEKGYWRKTNNAGGIEGGISNGEPVVLRFFMKPLPANANLDSVNLVSKKSERPAFYRSDVEAVAAAVIAAESVMAIQIASEILTVTGGDNFAEIHRRFTRLKKMQKR